MFLDENEIEWNSFDEYESAPTCDVCGTCYQLDGRYCAQCINEELGI